MRERERERMLDFTRNYLYLYLHNKKVRTIPRVMDTVKAVAFRIVVESVHRHKVLYELALA